MSSSSQPAPPGTLDEGDTSRGDDTGADTGDKSGGRLELE